jgi:site-specific recombinase XerD
VAKVKMPKVPEIVIPTFSEKEIERLLAQADKSSNEGFRDYCILLTFIDTGIRLSELAELKVDDVDYDQMAQTRWAAVTTQEDRKTYSCIR